MKIYKYRLAITDRQIVRLPQSAVILCVQMQWEHVCMWALVDEKETKEIEYAVRIIGTGNPIPEEICTNQGMNLIASYIDTVQDGQFVWHVFASPHI